MTHARDMVHCPGPSSRLVRLLIALAVAVPTLVGTAGRLAAHNVSRNGLGTAVQVVLADDRVKLTFDLGFGAIWARAEMLKMDDDGDLEISEAEAEAYRARAWTEHVSPNLTVAMNGIPIPLRLVTSRAETLPGPVGLVPFDVYYDLEAEIPWATAEDRGRNVLLEVENLALLRDSTTPPLFYIPYGGHAADCTFRILEPEPLADLQNHIGQGRKLVIKFEMSGGAVPEEDARLLDPRASGAAPSADELAPESGAAGGTSSGATQAPDDTRPGIDDPPTDASDADARGPDEHDADAHEDEESIGTLLDILRTEDLCLVLALVALGIAFLLGAGHALEPGHGKSMVAAYLVGTRGRFRDAILLGVVVTITHTFSVFLLGLAIFACLEFLDEGVARERAVAVSSLVGAGMLLGVGLWVFFTRTRAIGSGGHAEHSHSHSHGHSHHHSHHHVHRHVHGDEHGGADGDRDGEQDEGRDGDAVGNAIESSAHTHDHSHEPAHVHGGAQPASRWEMISLGIAGGIVPCHGGLAVLSLGLSIPERFGFALLLLLVFSVGLGAVLVAIGALVVAGRGFLVETSPRRARIARYLPLASALFLIALGAFFVVSNVTEHWTVLDAFARDVGGWFTG